MLLRLHHALVNRAPLTPHSRMRTQKARTQVEKVHIMAVAKATRLSWGSLSQQAAVWRAWASSFARLWAPTAARANCALAIPAQPAQDSRCHFRLPRSTRSGQTATTGRDAPPLLPLALPHVKQRLQPIVRCQHRPHRMVGNTRTWDHRVMKFLTRHASSRVNSICNGGCSRVKRVPNSLFI